MFYLPDSWQPMGLIMGAFAIKHFVRARLAMKPEMAMNVVFSSMTGYLNGDSLHARTVY